jgi:hypothetical protein
VFFLQSTSPAHFSRDEKVEMAADDGSFHTMLDLADGSLMLEDAKTAVATVEPLARFGASAFGQVRVRPVSADGITGDWLELGTLVRLPDFKDLRCPRAVTKPCVLSGDDLFLADTISSTPDFNNAVEVPTEFTGTQLTVPHPANGQLFLKLRDDPGTIQTLTMPVTLLAMPHLPEPVYSPSAPASAPTAATPAAAPQTTAPEPAQPAPQTNNQQQSPAPPAAAPATESAPPVSADQTKPN